MKKLAIISEFNPFHNGHKYLLERARDETQADLALTIMSGDFVQRGEPAIIDKFSRAEVAMIAGFDMVIEMPVHISLQSAEYFALGSVKILEKLNIDYLCFGIENIEPEDFLKVVATLIKNDDRLDELTKKYMVNSSFTKARYDATVEILGDNGFITSNNILALEYIRAIKKINSKMVPIPIKRTSSLNTDTDLREVNISSSTAIRNNINADYKDHVPDFSFGKIEENKKAYGLPSYDFIYDTFKFLLIMERRPMAGIMGYEEGIENYLLKIASENNDFETFINRATTKRYTSARIKRLMINYILENKAAFNSFDLNFYKVLAFNKKAESILKESTAQPVLTKSDEAKLTFTDRMILSQMLDASNLYALATDRELNYDYKRKIKKF